ncbi:MAG: threonylcarbamoyl-AMP synthase [Clostridia bacterium]|nr:threonylcarbamoyl-AMP synthase [Clostridia bacterium]
MQTMIGKAASDIRRAAELLRAGELVAFPTETVYGLGGNALDKDAARHIYAVKGRPSDNPLIVHLWDWSQAGEYAYVTAEGKALYDAFCPGPLTMIFKKKPCIPDETTGGRDTVALRFPSHPVARALLKECGLPIAAPSANVSKHVSPTTSAHVYDDLNGAIPLILDGGDSEVGIESTIVDLTGDCPTVLRPGAITKEQIAAVLGNARNYAGKVTEALAPGMKYKHYSPRVPCYLVKRERLWTAYRELAEKGLRAVLIAREETGAGFRGTADVLSLGNTPEEAQRYIYAALRDAEKYDAAIIEDLSDIYGYFAAMDRIGKATGGSTL